MYPSETIPAKFVYSDEEDPDTFQDEICLVLKEKEGLAVVTGCAHTNTTEARSTPPTCPGTKISIRRIRPRNPQSSSISQRKATGN